MVFIVQSLRKALGFSNTNNHQLSFATNYYRAVYSSLMPLSYTPFWMEHGIEKDNDTSIPLEKISITSDSLEYSSKVNIQ